MNFFYRKNLEFLKGAHDKLLYLESKLSPNSMSLVYAIAASIFGYSQSVLAKNLVKKISPLQVISFVALICFLLSRYCSFVCSPIEFNVKNRSKFIYMTLRNSLSFFSSLIFFFYLTQYLPLSMMNSLYAVNPVLVFLFDRIICSTPLKSTEILGSFISFLGILLVVDVFQWGGKKNSENSNENFNNDQIKYSLIGLLACAGFSAGNILMKELQNIKSLILVFNMYINGFLLSNLIMIIKGEKIDFIKNPIDLLFIILTGVFQFGFMMTFTRALQLGKKGRVVVLTNLQLVYSFIGEIVFLGEIPTWIRFMGSVILVLGVMRAVL